MFVCLLVLWLIRIQEPRTRINLINKGVNDIFGKEWGGFTV